MATPDRLRRILLLIALLVAAPATPAFSQPRPPSPPRDTRAAGQAPVPAGTASITGVVTVAGSGQPARKARVTLSGGEVRTISRTTDNEGRFAFVALVAGRYTLSASKPGHVNITYGQHRPGTGRPGTPIQLTEGQRFTAQLQIPRGGAITGTVLDEHGEANPGVQVRAMRWTTQSGSRMLQPAGGGSTDDRGIYRIFNLQPGEYVICATPRNVGGDDMRMQMEMEVMQRIEAVAQRDAVEARAMMDRVAAMQAQAAANPEERPSGYAPVCFPGTPSSSGASPIGLGPGEERTGVDFQLQVAPLASVEGTVINPSGAALQGLQVMMAAPGDTPGEMRSARPDAEGRFRFSGVPPGQYTLSARGNAGPPRVAASATPAGSVAERVQDGRAQTEAPRFWALMDVAVDGRDVTNVILQLTPGMTIAGQLTFDGVQQVPTDLTRLRVNAQSVATGTAPIFPSSTQARVEANGRFTISNVVPGKYRLNASGVGGGWYVESAVVSGQDTLDIPIEVRPHQNITGATITLTDRQAEFSGSIINERNEPVSAYTVILFPSDSRYWLAQSRRIQTARPATDGRFSLRGLPPGEYRLATVLDPEPGSWYDPAFLQQLQGSTTTVTLAAGEKKSQDIRITTQ